MSQHNGMDSIKIIHSDYVTGWTRKLSSSSNEYNNLKFLQTRVPLQPNCLFRTKPSLMNPRSSRHIEGRKLSMEFVTSTRDVVQILTLRIVKHDMEGCNKSCIRKDKHTVVTYFKNVFWHSLQGRRKHQNICCQDRWTPDGFSALLTTATALTPWTGFSNDLSAECNTLNRVLEWSKCRQ
jgi:hypothetical protein